jgi:glucose-1-phosphate cytidylyltransferase
VEPWRVTLVDTGERTMTGGRLRRVRDYVAGETFCLTYGDGVTDVSIHDLVAFHRSQQTYLTLTAVQPPGRFGAFSLDADETRVRGFKEKPNGDGAWVNGGFFVCEPQVFDFIESDDTVWENEPMERLSHEHHLSAFRHDGFWQSMDTLRDKIVLEDLWQSGQAPWKNW